MGSTKTSAIAYLMTLSLWMAPALGSDTAKEKRWAEQIVDGIFDGEPKWLKAEGHKFLGIYTPATSSKPKGGALILHGVGVHPDWPQIINPLRVSLPARGWTTLSLQMPILKNEAKIEEYTPLFKEVPGRLNAGIAFLKAQGIQNIVIIAHSMGSAMASHYLANTGDATIKAYVGIGMVGNRSGTVLDNDVSLKKIGLPVLDIYGSNDIKPVLESVSQRANAAKTANNTAYTQTKIDGADHFFEGHEKQLLDTITIWLEKTVK